MKRKRRAALPADPATTTPRPPGPWAFLARFLAALAVALIAIAWFPAIESWGIRSTLASMSGLAWLLGLPAVIEENRFSLGASTVRVVSECTPVMPIAVLAAAILAYPTRWRSRLLGIAIGSVVVWAFNLIRIAGVLAVLAWRPASFDFVHMYLWQPATLLVVLSIFMVWLRLQAATRQPA